MESAPAHVIGLVDLIKRTGAWSLQMREVDDPPPLCWVVVVTHYIDEEGMPTADTQKGEQHYEAVAAMDLGTALKRMAEVLMDGGMCMTCKRPTAFYTDLDGAPGAMELFACCTYWDGDKYMKTCGRETT